MESADNNFFYLKGTEKENLIMKEVIRCLKNIGGVGSKKEIVELMKESSSQVPEEFIELVKVSKKTKKSYKPFDYALNFAIKHLIYGEFLRYDGNQELILTEKGRKVQLNDFDPNESVRKISQVIFDQKSAEKTAAKTLAKENIEEDFEEEAPENKWEEDLATALKNMTPQKFEVFARRLVREMGVTLDSKIGVDYVGDGGLDGYGYMTSDDFRTARVAIQAKRWNQPVGSPEIDKFRGAMDKFNAEFGIFITTSSFSSKAIEASRTGTRVITLIDGDKIAELVKKYQLYVRPITTYVLEEFYTSKD